MSSDTFNSIFEENSSADPLLDTMASRKAVEDPHEAINYSIDIHILMHRDAHFGGSFDTMLEYYSEDRLGVNEELPISRIQELHQIEQTSKENLAGRILSGAEAELIIHSRDIYLKLRSIYEEDSSKNLIPRLIADLIFAQDDPSKEIEAIVKKNELIVPELLLLVKSEHFYDPLFPGYGYAPERAMMCLGLIGDKRAIPILFERVRMEDPFEDEAPLKALQLLRQPAKKFLLKILSARPLTRDNDRAAYILADRFSDDTEVAQASLEQLKDHNIQKRPSCTSELLIACQSLPSHLRESCLNLLDSLPSSCFVYNGPDELREEWK